jgi:hypothetical protein
MKLKCWQLPVLLLLVSSCRKDAAFIPPQDGPVPIRTKDLTLAIPFTECINSYADLLEKLGNSRVVKSVILKNGVSIDPGGKLISMQYFAKPAKEENSLFRSLFIANYEDGSHLVNSSQNVWSLGCKMVERGIPPFTNILYRNKAYMINTCFYWSVPGIAAYDYRILWLVL